MTSLAERYAIPEELMHFVDSGFLRFLGEHPSEKTVEFHVPAIRRADAEGRGTSYSLTWIHPNFNADFCHYFTQTPGDLPNFYVNEDTTDVGDDLLEIDSVDELVGWLEETQKR